MTPRTARTDELKDLWVSFAGRGGGHSKELILKIYYILLSVEDGEGRISRQELRDRLLKEYDDEGSYLLNFDRVMRKLEDQQLIRKEIEDKPDVNTPNKKRTYYRLNSGLVHRAIVLGGSQLIIPNYREDPPDAKIGEMWLFNPDGPLPPPVDTRDILRMPEYRDSPKKPRVGEMWITDADKVYIRIL